MIPSNSIEKKRLTDYEEVRANLPALKLHLQEKYKCRVHASSLADSPKGFGFYVIYSGERREDLPTNYKGREIVYRTVDDLPKMTPLQRRFEEGENLRESYLLS